MTTSHASFIPAGPDDPFTGHGGSMTGRRSPTDIVAERTNPDHVPADLREALYGLGNSICGDPRDWGAYYRDAWIYGVLVGWGCEDHPDDEPCDTCGTPDRDPIAAMAEKHGWSADAVARLKRYRAAVVRALGEPA